MTRTSRIIDSTPTVLNKLAGDAQTGPGAERPSAWLPRWMRSPRAIQPPRQRADVAFVQPLKTALDDLRNLLKAQPVTRENLPPDTGESNG